MTVTCKQVCQEFVEAFERMTDEEQVPPASFMGLYRNAAKALAREEADASRTLVRLNEVVDLVERIQRNFENERYRVPLTGYACRGYALGLSYCIDILKKAAASLKELK